MGFKLGKALGINKVLGGGIGKVLGGAFGGPIGGLIGDKVAGQLFGGDNRPSSFLAPQNPNYDRLQNSALQQQQMGADTALKYMGLLNGAIQNRANSITAGYGDDDYSRMALGQAQAGADAAFKRARSGLAGNLTRRGGVGGGLLAGGLGNIEGQRASTMANAYNNVARERIARNIAGQQELLQLYGNQQNLGNLLRQQADQQLLGLGNMESQRKAQGQALTGDFFQELGGYLGQPGKQTAPQYRAPQFPEPLEPTQPINPATGMPKLGVGGYFGMTRNRTQKKNR